MITVKELKELQKQTGLKLPYSTSLSHAIELVELFNVQFKLSKQVTDNFWICNLGRHHGIDETPEGAICKSVISLINFQQLDRRP